MMLSFDMLKQKYRLRVTGVVHVGAHFGQEYATYRGHGISRMVFFEPLPEAYARLKNSVGPEARIVNKAAGNFNGPVEMFVEKANHGMSSSVLRPKRHLVEHPGIVFEEQRETVEMVRLDDFPLGEACNMMVLDTQGYELEVLKGAERFLSGVDYIITEVNDAELYEGCALVDGLDHFLGTRGFSRRETYWTGSHWGDAFYIREAISSK
jgi:FkbM family methyltransferase